MSETREFAIGLARQAAEIMSSNFGFGTTSTAKSDGSPVTIADTAINRLVIDTVRSTFPDHAVVGEEESMGNPDESMWAWVCDPIDGTLPFKHGIPISSFSLALTQNGIPVLGVVIDPFMQRLFVGEIGMGATLNGAPIHVNNEDELLSAAVVCEAHASHIEGSTIRRALKARGAYPLSLASWVYPTCLLAAGELVGTIICGKVPWDAAAVKVIVEEAGGRVTDLRGNEQRYDRAIAGVIASNGRVHQQLIEAVAEEIAGEEGAAPLESTYPH